LLGDIKKKGRKMLQQFNDVVNDAESGMKSATRALQAWQYLIGKAANRQIVQYEELRILMEYPTSNPLASILGCIMFCCQQNSLPPLSIIVVNRTGVPGEGFTAADWDNYHQRREDVFNFPWFKLVPPSILEFREAYTRGMQH
jgi:hypothetical protein